MTNTYPIAARLCVWAQYPFLSQFSTHAFLIIHVQSDLEPCYQLAKRQRVAAQVGGSGIQIVIAALPHMLCCFEATLGHAAIGWA